MYPLALALILATTVPAEQLPAALARLTGVFDVPVHPQGTVSSPGFVNWFLEKIGFSDGSSNEQSSFLYFALPSNAAQDQVVSMLDRHGCCVIVGPPGTGKSQAILNVVGHYLATGKKVLVSSKGQPATEVLRQKLPEGVRELAISLGSADAASYRRLEAAVEHLANEVAPADVSKLKREEESLRRRHAAITDELGRLERKEEQWAQPYFPVETPQAESVLASPIATVPLHAAHFAALELSNNN